MPKSKQEVDNWIKLATDLDRVRLTESEPSLSDDETDAEELGESDIEADWQIIDGVEPDKILPEEGRKKPESTIAIDPALAAKALQKMGRCEEQADKFHELLKSNSERLRDGGYDELLEIARTVGWLQTERCLQALEAVLKEVPKWKSPHRPKLLSILTDQLEKFPPQEGNYDEPTEDQVSGFNAILLTMSKHLQHGYYSEVLPGLLDALGAMCGGLDWYMGELSLKEAVAKANRGGLLRELVRLAKSAGLPQYDELIE